MRITKRVEEGRTILSVSGTIDNVTAPEFGRELLALDYNGLDLTVDLGHTPYITSAGLRMLLVARKRLTAETMRIVRVNAAVRMVLETTGFSDMIRVTPAVVPPEDYRLSMPELLKKRVEAGAEETAYLCSGRELTWRDTDCASHIIARDLSRQGVGKGTHVGICAPNSFGWICAFFAVQKLGAVAVLLNPGLRPAELKAVCETGGVTHLCFEEIPGKTDRAEYRRECLGGSFPRVMYDIPALPELLERLPEYGSIAGLFREDRYADDPSVIIFSSGSTGRPKAILSSAYDLLASIEPLITEMRITGEDINLAFLPMFHVFGFATCISAGLLTGYRSVIPEDKQPDTMIRLISEYGCTVFNTVPTMILMMLRSPIFAPDRLRSLRLSILGGAATTREQMEMLRGLLPGTHFGNIYGMSENAAVSLTLYEDSVEHITRTVGRPVPGLELRFRDPFTGAPLPPGKGGEICVRSETMAVGYYGLPPEQQPIDDEGWLLTGDLGMLDSDGYLHLSGRCKDLIISGGENLSPGEIAEAVSALPGIADVKVFGVPDELMGEVPAAAVILKEGAEWDEAEARERLSHKLAAYKLPVYFFVTDSFPLLASGKADIKAIKAQISQKR